jgi:hypothetical protein
MKFKSQLEDSVCGRDICHAVFRENAEKRHKHFKARRRSNVTYSLKENVYQP